jgi:hypothetical protein
MRWQDVWYQTAGDASSNLARRNVLILFDIFYRRLRFIGLLGILGVSILSAEGFRAVGAFFGGVSTRLKTGARLLL